MIALLDYGSGNLRSVHKALLKVGADVRIAKRPEEMADARAVVLPGVGAFDDCIHAMEKQALLDACRQFIKSGRPFLGICVGMQWMFERSQESPETRGLGVLDGECERFPASVKSPHVGWNQLEVDSRSRLLRGLPPGTFVYFTHSFRAPVGDTTVACCEYGGRFSAAVERDHLCGVQFHLEKSGEAGLKILGNFCAV